MLWSWYLADDTQFYIIGAIILIVAVRSVDSREFHIESTIISPHFLCCSHFKVASSMLAFFMVSSWATTAYIAFDNNHIPNTDDPLALFDKIYDKPWTRLGPYLVGMCVGWFLFKTNCKIRMRRVSIANFVQSSKEIIPKVNISLFVVDGGCRLVEFQLLFALANLRTVRH